MKTCEEYVFKKLEELEKENQLLKEANKVLIDKNFQTNISGLYVGGDGAGLTRGLMQASANGILLANILVNKK